MENALVKLDPKEYGLEESRAKEVEVVFLPMLEKMKSLEAEYNTIINQPINEEVCKKARELRLKYVKVRTGTAQIHKEVKAFYLAGGKFVDGWKNAQLYASQGIEQRLESIEKHYELIEAERKTELQKERFQLYRPYSDYVDGTPQPDFTMMSQEVWVNFLEGSKKRYNDKVEAEKKAELERIAKEKAELEARLAKEKAEKEEQDRIRLENEKLQAEKKRLEEEAKRKEAEEKAEREKLEAENRAKLEAERKEKERLLKEQEEKNRIEKERIEKENADRLAKEKAEKDKLEAELKAKQLQEQQQKEAEKKRIEAEEMAKRKAEQAPDKEKLKLVGIAIKNIRMPELNSEPAKLIRRNLIQDLDKIILRFFEEVEKL